LFTTTGRADSLDGLSGYNLVALNGNITEGQDVGGRVAASGYITGTSPIGQQLSSTSQYSGLDVFVAGNEGSALGGNVIQVQGAGNVYANGASSSSFHYQNVTPGTVFTSGPSPINFAAADTQLTSESLYLSSLTTTGTVGGTDTHCGSCLMLTGTSSVLNVFNITAAQLASNNNPIDIVTPSGSTTIINVIGISSNRTDSDSLGTQVYLNGSQQSNTSQAASNILWNLYDASQLTLNGGIFGSVLATNANISGGAIADGDLIGASIGYTGEVHDDEFTGVLPTPSVVAATPEPGSLVLLGTGIVGMAGLLRRRLA
jgi:choice-of-anchor A domain-containing protein